MFRRSLVVFGLLLSFSVELYAGASLLLTEKRIVFSERQRSAEIIIKNNGDETGRYEISILEKEMMQDGRVVDTDSPQASIKKMLRYSPRRVSLQPGEAQTIRVALRKPKDLAPGEYRSHMRFTAMPIIQANTASDTDEELSLSTKMLLSYTIAVILRQGELDAAASIDSAQVVKAESGYNLNFNINREGRRSLYGAIKVTSVDDPELVLASLTGLGVYTPLAARQISIPLKLPAGGALPSQLRLQYIEDVAYGGDLNLESIVDAP